MQLSNSEEQLMQHLWKLEKAFMKDLLDQYPDPKPATTTVATLLKRIIDKNFRFIAIWRFYDNKRISEQ